MKFDKELVDNLNRAKQELNLARDEDDRDACWDEVEQCWYALMDEYDTKELEEAGITPN